MRRQKLLNLLLLLSLAALPLSGCYDLVELEGMAFIVSLGIDKAEGDSTIQVTARIAVPSEMQGGGGSGGKSDSQPGGSKPLTVKAHTLPQAISLMNASVERRISLLHLTTIFIGEDLAREGVIELLRPLTRIREMRRTINLFVVPGSARESFVENRPVMESSMVRWQEAMGEVNSQSGLTPRQRLHEFVIATESPLEDAIAPIIAVNKSMKQDSNDPEAYLQSADISFEPGKVARIGGNNLEFMGTAVFREDKLVTIMDGIDTRMLLMIRGELTRTEMDFPDLLAKEHYVALELKHARSPVADVDFSAKPIRIKVREKLEGDLVGIQSEIDYTQPKNMELLEKEVRKRLERRQQELMETIYHDDQADPFGVFKHNRSAFSTDEEIRRFDLRKALKKAQVDVTVDLKIRRIGIQFAPIKSK